MNALAAMRVLTKEADRFGNTEVARTHLARTSPSYVGHLLLLHEAEWGNWGKLEETIRTGHSPVTRHVFETDPELGANVLSVLDRIGQQSGPALATRVELGEARTLLDLGGGGGMNVIGFCTIYSGLRRTVVDLMETVKAEERALNDAGFDARIPQMA